MHFVGHLARLVPVFALSLASVAGQAQAPMYGDNISLDSARKVSAAAEAAARANNWNMVIAVVDAGGHLVMLQRLDGTQYGSVEVATRKAQSAVAYRRPTKAFEDALKGGNPQVASLSGVMPSEGGLPIVVDGKIVGGIGVSGGSGVQDGQVAKAGMEALK